MSPDQRFSRCCLLKERWVTRPRKKELRSFTSVTKAAQIYQKTSKSVDARWWFIKTLLRLMRQTQLLLLRSHQDWTINPISFSITSLTSIDYESRIVEIKRLFCCFAFHNDALSPAAARWVQLAAAKRVETQMLMHVYPCCYGTSACKVQETV